MRALGIALSFTVAALVAFAIWRDLGSDEWDR